MWQTLLLSAVLGADPGDTPGRAVVDEARRPASTLPSYLAPAAPPSREPLTRTAAAQPPLAASEPVVIEAPLLPTPAPKPPEAPAAAAPTPPDRWFLMRQLQGNWLGALLDDNRTSISGWIEQSFTASQNHTSNQPVVWNDRANDYLLQQFWLRLDRGVVTTGTSEPTWGYRLDLLTGSDYRFTQQRGLFTSQLANSKVNPNEATGFSQSLYGIDPIQFYTNVYMPTWFAGTDVRVGRLYTPWGYESLEGISTPFASRSYAFNWSPPFTHMGIQVSPTFNNMWSGKFMLANGNDVFLNSPSQEMRFVGALTYTSYDKRDVVTLGWTAGRGKFNASEPHNAATVGEQFEPAGRNNINVIDLVWTHAFNSRTSYAAEAIFGYQTGVPANVSGGIISEGRTVGTAHWASLVHYFNYQITPELQSITRFETFQDFEGQRTGFEGLYTAITTGVQYKPTKYLLIRPELRYDYNGYSKPFEGRHGLYTAAIDAIVRF
jgi:hypothetical protein